ncbi:MAG TPA: enoyl-CoA hydratase-related protein [Acidimicrobiales bacterium]|nr:enoyl-CoA hydratase-related protein [Acidimicrobiales bacterium]
MSEAQGSPGLVVEHDGPVLRLTLDRPDKRNALDDATVAALTRRLEEAGDDEAVRVVHLTGAGEHFCAGFDIVARNAPGGRRPRAGSTQRRLPHQAHRLVPTLLAVQTPVVCEVRGWAAGIGLHLALASDFAVVANGARLWEPFAERGFTPDSAGTWLLPRRIGEVRAREMLLLGRALNGSEAAEWGMVHRSVPDGELHHTVEALLAELAEGPTVTLGLMKWLLLTGSSSDVGSQLEREALALEVSSRSEDFKEGLAAFSEKRRPRLTGR